MWKCVGGSERKNAAQDFIALLDKMYNPTTYKISRAKFLYFIFYIMTSIFYILYCDLYFLYFSNIRHFFLIYPIIIWRNKKAACAICGIKIKKQERYDIVYHIYYYSYWISILLIFLLSFLFSFLYTIKHKIFFK